MSFISSPANVGKGYAPGYILVHADCKRLTGEVAQNHAQVVTTAEGGKYVPMGAFWPANDSATVEGILYEDVDVTTGNMPGSIVKAGTVYLDRLPAAPASGVQAALEAKGITFVTSDTAVTRPY